MLNVRKNGEKYRRADEEQTGEIICFILQQDEFLESINWLISCGAKRITQKKVAFNVQSFSRERLASRSLATVECFQELRHTHTQTYKQQDYLLTLSFIFCQNKERVQKMWFTRLNIESTCLYNGYVNNVLHFSVLQQKRDLATASSRQKSDISHQLIMFLQGKSFEMDVKQAVLRNIRRADNCIKRSL